MYARTSDAFSETADLNNSMALASLFRRRALQPKSVLFATAAGNVGSAVAQNSRKKIGKIVVFVIKAFLIKDVVCYIASSFFIKQTYQTAMFTVASLLVPIDFSENSLRALALAKEVAKGSKATLHLLHVVEPVVYPADWSYAQVGFADIELELEENSKKELQALADTLKTEGFTTETATRRGRASDEVCAYAADHGISIIAIGTHGRSGFEHFLFGSTTERVLRKAPCPVLSVRLDQQKPGGKA